MDVITHNSDKILRHRFDTVSKNARDLVVITQNYRQNLLFRFFLKKTEKERAHAKYRQKIEKIVAELTKMTPKTLSNAHFRKTL